LRRGSEAVAGTSPQDPRAGSRPTLTTSTDPAGASATATWIARLSAVLHTTGNAGPLTRAPGHTGRMRGAIGRPPLSPSVAAPRAATVDASSLVMCRCLAEGE